MCSILFFKITPPYFTFTVCTVEQVFKKPISKRFEKWPFPRQFCPILSDYSKKFDCYVMLRWLTPLNVVFNLAATCTVDEVRADYVKLSWEPPEDDGGTPIVKYIIRLLDLDYNEWINACEVIIVAWNTETIIWFRGNSKHTKLDVNVPIDTQFFRAGHTTTLPRQRVQAKKQLIMSLCIYWYSYFI